MKGFFIEVTNNLLDPKHQKAIGPAVWEFMWCLDKITLIGEDGIGWVWGRKPVLVEDIRSEIGCNEKTVRRNMARLEAAGYIIRVRTPRGISIGVAKAKKRFGRSDRTKMSGRSDINVRSNIRHNKDNKQNANEQVRSRSKGMVIGDDVNYDVDEDGNERTHDGFGRPLRKGPKPKTEGKNKIALRIVHKFAEMCKKEVGVMPVMNAKGYHMALFALKTGGLTEAQVYDLFDEWFKLGKPDEEAVSIGRALSTNQINGYKVRNNVQ